MSGKRARRAALLLWAVFAFVVWNVVFDRKVYQAAVHFTQAQIHIHQRGEAVATIESAFMPQVSDAAIVASLWGGVVLITGLLLVVASDRSSRKS